MIQKKTNTLKAYSIRTISQYVSDYKVIIGAVAVVLGTVGSLIFGAINFYIGTRTSPIFEQVQAVQSKQIILEQALVDIKDTNKRIESKTDRILLKLIPNFNFNNSQ